MSTVWLLIAGVCSAQAGCTSHFDGRYNDLIDCMIDRAIMLNKSAQGLAELSRGVGYEIKANIVCVPWSEYRS